MAIRTIPLAPSEFFHIYNRGTDKRQIFFDQADYHRFLELLYVCNTSQAINIRDVRKVHNSVFEFNRNNILVSIGAYCLMPNHFHILITTEVEGGISTFLRKVATAYSMYFNKRYTRTGALFQGRFKAEYADTDEYLKYLYSYIHLNPVKLIDKNWREEGIKDVTKSFDFVAFYKYSSLSDYLRSAYRDEGKIINPTPFPDYFQTTKDLKTELFQWLTYSDYKP